MKVLIVDDGYYIVEYLKHLLDWKEFGVNQVETTTNSIEAKRMLKESSADILITDIRMPEVSGIDLLEYVGELKLKTKVIFLSGYSEFEYAQKAIRLGAFDYLLKPVDKDDMEKVIRDVTKVIEESQPEGDTAWEPYDSLGYLLAALSENESLIQEFKPIYNGFEQNPMCFFRLSPADRIEEGKLRETLEGFNAYIWAAPPSLAGIVPESETQKLKAVIPSITLSEAFQFNLKDSVRYSFYQFFYQEEVGPNDFSLLRNKEEFSKLESRKWECSGQRIQKEFPKLMNRKQRVIYLLEVIHYLYLTNDNLRAEEVLEWIIHRLEDPCEAYEYVILTISRLGKEADLSNEDIIDNVRKYIVSHIDEALSLEDLGRIVHLHPVYLSKFYKQETGENLSSYILFKRLERASKLLIESNLHVVDISHMVGYKKSQYFIKLFKERYGVTPQQYRKQQIKLK
ncbi:response regulator [Paenibacillus sp. S150]|uniref:response regulator transcription factor n=1 Tax=Paenibacillus sp. S150 TaxID=2749826 RepID=UPI001C598F54|nr:response regulator [Paenibacillus sp. S150]MBW4080012.1 response regulator [Paenibacillus sp. S150]